MKGKLIVITGLDGSGTTTLARNLHELDKGSHLLRTPDFPFDQGRDLIDSLVREKSQPAHYLYYLSSVIHASARIEEMLKTGNVYCVRYLIDTVVSHRVAGLDVDMIYNGGFYNIRKPDLTIFVSVNENIRQERITSRGKGLLDKVLDHDSTRHRFEEEFNRLSSHFVTIDNSNTTHDQFVNEATKYISWIKYD